VLLRDDATLRLVDLWRKETLEGGLRAMLGRGDGVVKFKLNGWRERRWVMGDLGRKERQARIERAPATIAQHASCSQGMPEKEAQYRRPDGSNFPSARGRLQ